MNAIILAAGEGKRLRPLTNHTPKCLIRLFGKSLIEWQVDAFRHCGIDDISVVTGYCGNQVRVPGVATVVNENYANTNMVESLICARSKFAESTIISYGDIVYERSVLTKLIAADDSIAVVVDENWKRYWELRFVNPLDDAESLKIDSEGYLTSIGQKEISFESIAAQYIGLMKFQSDGVRALERFYDDAKSGAASRLLPVRNGSSFEQIYMTDLLQGLINAGHKLKAIPIKSGWLEIDSLTDYETYLRMHAENTLRPFFDTRSD